MHKHSAVAPAADPFPPGRPVPTRPTCSDPTAPFDPPTQVDSLRLVGYIFRSGVLYVPAWRSWNRSNMIEIQIGEGDRIEWALKQFRRKMLRSGLFKDMKKKRFYEKPSEARKRKAADARRRNARARRRR
jgi:small subunit ribosomal protein S21